MKRGLNTRLISRQRRKPYDKQIACELFLLMKNPPRLTDWGRFVEYANMKDWKNCWEWAGSIDKDGYGEFSGTYNKAHRVIAQWLYGLFPRNIVIDHLVCSNRCCVNPLHLLPCTSRENTMRSNAPPALNARKTHCPRGHALISGNLEPNNWRKGKRSCLICHREHGRKAAIKNRAKDNGIPYKIYRKYLYDKQMQDPAFREAKAKAEREYYQQNLERMRTYYREWKRRKKELVAYGTNS